MVAVALSESFRVPHGRHVLCAAEEAALGRVSYMAVGAVTVGAVAVRAVAVRRMNVRWAALSAAQSERVRAMRRVSRGADMAGL